MSRSSFSVSMMTLCAFAFAPSVAAADTPLIVDKAILLMRHGIRAPLAGEVPEGTRTAQPWPRWPVGESHVTPHGRQALARVAVWDRVRLISLGLLPASGCPRPGTVAIRTNSSERTIESGEAYGRALAPGCALPVRHFRHDRVDPIFEPLRARATDFDPRRAIASIDRSTGGMTALVARHAAAITALDEVLGCVPRGAGCVPGGRAGVESSTDGGGIDLGGPIRATSGVAQVLLLQYVEGFPAGAVGWGKVDARMVRRLGALHAALFDVFTRPPYMAAHQAAVLGRDIIAALSARAGPTRIRVLMGHDTNVDALAGALRIHLRAPGYAVDDVPPGGAILIERAHTAGSARRFVRLFYRTQPPTALRTGRVDVDLTPLRIPGCGGSRTDWCPLPRFVAMLDRNIVPPRVGTTD